MLLKLAVLLIFACAATGQILSRPTRPGPVIYTSAGPIQGLEETYDRVRLIYTYRGIRYAQAPVGNLRFRAPVAAAPWQSTFQAFDYGSVCPQFSLFLNRFQGEEDCLFLNIATPTNIGTRLPVVVNIHGGGLQIGDGEFDTFGPEHINEEGVIFVSLNYRLNVLGFLNTGDASSPGNYAIKDMILALRWIQNNIEAFGGNRNDVTVMGISGGAIGVHALVVSPVASGLFHRAASHSGSMFSNWGFNRNPQNSVQRMVQRLNIQATNNADLLNQLRQMPLLTLLEGAGPFQNELPQLIDELLFMPSIDPITSLEPIILPASPESMVRSGNVNRVPYMVGFNGQESLWGIPDINSDPSILARFNQNPHLLVPGEWNLAQNSAGSLEVIASFRNLYFGGATVITEDMGWQWVQYLTDREMAFGISKQARLHAPVQPVYYNRFSYFGSLNFVQRVFGLSHLPGAAHGDDVYYLFRMNIVTTPVLPSDPAWAVQRRQTRMWTNFFKFGNPTPNLSDPLINVIWPTMTASEQFMDVQENLVVDVHPNRARMDVWHAFDQRFGH